MIKRLLYLGLDPQHYRHQTEAQIVHWPIIQIIPRPLSDPLVKDSLLKFPLYSHIVITSKSTIKILLNYLSHLEISLNHWQDKLTIATGKATAAALIQTGITPTKIAKEETAEGVLAELEQLDLTHAHLFWPHSSQARPVIKDFFMQKQLCHTTCPFYDPVPYCMTPIPNLNEFDGIVFTSPSTVEAFFQFFKTLPPHLEVFSIGPITHQCVISLSPKTKN